MPGKETSLNNQLDEACEGLLIRGVCDGEHDAFYKLIQPYERRVYAAALRHHTQRCGCRGRGPGCDAESLQEPSPVSR
jgi:hypothetical protein